MKYCLFFWHEWKRYDELVEQLFTGGYYAFQRCQKCRKIKFGKCEKYGPEELGWKERKAEVARIIATGIEPAEKE